MLLEVSSDVAEVVCFDVAAVKLEKIATYLVYELALGVSIRDVFVVELVTAIPDTYKSSVLHKEPMGFFSEGGFEGLIEYQDCRRH